MLGLYLLAIIGTFMIPPLKIKMSSSYKSFKFDGLNLTVTLIDMPGAMSPLSYLGY